MYNKLILDWSIYVTPYTNGQVDFYGQFLAERMKPNLLSGLLVWESQAGNF